MIKVPMGRRVCLATEVSSSLSEGSEGFTFEAVAQLYGRVNDRLMVFLRNSGAKTIQERVPRKAIKIHNGHPRGFLTAAAVTDTLGFVLRAEERQNRMLYTGFISEPHVDALARKFTNGTITENSMEMVILSAVERFVELDQVPELARPFAPMNSDGKAIVTGIKEFSWRHIGLVSGSAQDFNAILGPPQMVGLSGLPLSAEAWAPEDARAALSEWAGTVAMSPARPCPNLARLGCGYLAQLSSSDGDIVFAGQIAAPDESGRLVVSAGAIEPAISDLKTQLAQSELTESQQSDALGAAYELVGSYLRQGASLTPLAASDSPEEGTGAKALSDLESTGNSAAQEDSGLPQSDSRSTAGPASPPTAGGKSAALRAAQSAHLDRVARIEELQRRNPGVANEPTSPSRGPATGRASAGS